MGQRKDKIHLNPVSPDVVDQIQTLMQPVDPEDSNFTKIFKIEKQIDLIVTPFILEDLNFDFKLVEPVWRNPGQIKEEEQDEIVKFPKPKIRKDVKIKKVI